SSARRRSAASLTDAPECPARVLGEQLVVGVGVAAQQRLVLARADVAERDERVAAKPARVVLRDVQPVVLVDERAAVAFEPCDEIDVGAALRRVPRSALLDPAVPGADLLADVAAVD